jgi:hypothetical protein
MDASHEVVYNRREKYLPSMFSIMFLGKELTDTNDLGCSEAQACVELGKLRKHISCQ